MGIYQLAIRLGALHAAGSTPPAVGSTALAGTGSAESSVADPDPAPLTEPSPPPVALGQAELVHLADRFASGMPKVRMQAPLEDGWTWVNDLIVDAARLADGPEYPARPNGQCKSCAFRFMCPAQSPAPTGQPAALGTAEETGERSEALSTQIRARTSPDIPVRETERPRPATPGAPIQQTLWGDDL